MNTLDEQLALIQAHMMQRAIECLEHGVPDARWYPIAKDHLFNFQKYTYRFAPVNAQCWLIYDHERKRFIGRVFENAADAAKEVVELNNAFGPNRNTPVCMVPRDFQP